MKSLSFGAMLKQIKEKRKERMLNLNVSPVEKEKIEEAVKTKEKIVKGNKVVKK